MSEAAVKADALPPEAQIVEMVMAQFVSRLVHLTATLKLPDYLADGPKTAEELAPLTSTHAPTLYRVMRTLASLGLFTEDASHRFALQPLGAALKSGTPSHATALIMGGEMVARSLDNMLYSVQTGKTGFQKSLGVPLVRLVRGPSVGGIAVQPDHGGDPRDGASRGRRGLRLLGLQDHRRRRWLNRKSADHDSRPASRAARHPLRPAARGARRAGLHRAARPDGSYPDRNRIVLRPRACRSGRLHSFAHHPRLERRAVPDHPGPLPARDEPQLAACCWWRWCFRMATPRTPGKCSTWSCSPIPGGEERTAAQYAALLDKAGFRLTRVVPTASLVSIVEAAPR